MKVAEYIAEFLVAQGVGHVFEFVGGAITHLLDALYGREDVRCVSVHHEQAGGFAAEAYARINGHLGVAMATSGPGALNLLTPIGSCFFDSVPCLFLTGQVNTYEYKFDSPVRQIGFQETDIVSVARPLTKYAKLVTDPATIRYELEKAVAIARSGRPGPVLLDLPMNVQRSLVNPQDLPGYTNGGASSREGSAIPRCRAEEMEEAFAFLAAARRPLFLVGGGVRSGGACEELETLVNHTRVPVVTSLLGRDAFPSDHEAFFGMIGVYGNRYANLAAANCDTLFVLGSRLDTRQTGTLPETFARGARIVHVDIDPAELAHARERVFRGREDKALSLHCHVRHFLRLFLEHLRNAEAGGTLKDFASERTDWLKTLQGYRALFPSGHMPETFAGGGQRRPDDEEGGGPLFSLPFADFFVERLSGHCPDDAVVCVDVGQHQMWAGQSFSIRRGQRLLFSGGMGAMGFALPAGIGAAFAAKTSRVIVLVGDGGLQVNIQELDILAYHRLPVTVVVLDNGCLGMVRQFQDLYFGGRRQSTVIGYSRPDFVRIAEAYGIPAWRVRAREETEEGLRRAMSVRGPSLLHVELPLETVVQPKLVVNHPVEDMSPSLDPAFLRSLLLVEPLEDGERS